MFSTLRYGGVFLDGTGRMEILERSEATGYEIGRVYTIDGREWRCDSVTAYHSPTGPLGEPGKSNEGAKGSTNG